MTRHRPWTTLILALLVVSVLNHGGGKRGVETGSSTEGRDPVPLRTGRPERTPPHPVPGSPVPAGLPPGMRGSSPQYRPPRGPEPWQPGPARADRARGFPGSNPPPSLGGGDSPPSRSGAAGEAGQRFLTSRTGNPPPLSPREGPGHPKEGRPLPLGGGTPGKAPGENAAPPLPEPSFLSGLPEEGNRNPTPPGGVPESGPPTVQLLPSSSSLPVGESLTLEVRIRGGERVWSVPFHLLYPPDLLEYEGDQAGPFFGEDPDATLFLAGGAPGRLFVALAGMGGKGGSSGSGVLCRLYFRTRGPGRVELSFEDAHLFLAGGGETEARFLPAVLNIRGDAAAGPPAS